MFRCPLCDENSLEIGESLELTPNGEWDEEALQLISCSICESAGLALYQEHRRGALDQETTQHNGAFLPLAELLPIRASLLLCPKSKSAGCGCSIHREMRVLADAFLLRKSFELKR